VSFLILHHLLAHSPRSLHLPLVFFLLLK
jgi:hypothetical protein